MKRFIAVITACIILFCAVPLTANAYGGSIGDIRWQFNSVTETLTISGKGALPDYTESTYTPWKLYNDKIKYISIGEGITEIGDYNFTFCLNVSKVTCPTTLTRIGDAAFGWCYALESVKLNSGLEVIEDRAFVWCRNLRALSLPDSVTDIGKSITLWATAFEEYTVSANNASFTAKDGVLYNKDMTKLISYPYSLAGAFAIPDTVTEIGEEAFFASVISDVTLPASVVTVGDSAFMACAGLSGVHFEKGPTTIGDKAFNGCSSLKYITIPEGCVTIGEKTFSSCHALEFAVLPKSVTSIDTTAFSGTELKGQPDSYVERFAKQNGLNFAVSAYVVLDGELLEFDSAPIIYKGSTLVPMRKIFESLGAEVEWDNDTRTAIGINGDTTVKIQIGSRDLYKNGSPIELYQPAQLVSGRTLVPVRAISEAFNADVQWDGATYTVVITSK